MNIIKHVIYGIGGIIFVLASIAIFLNSITIAFALATNGDIAEIIGRFIDILIYSIIMAIIGGLYEFLSKKVFKET
jgi:hypothetical protein